MHTSIYAGLSGLLLVWLAFQVIKERRANKIKLGDNGVFELQSAIHAHGNFAEYMPITIILLFLFEYNGAPVWMIHLIGVTFLVGRWIHSQGLLKDDLRKRVQGMGFTFSILIGLAIANIGMVAFSILHFRLVPNYQVVWANFAHRLSKSTAWAINCPPYKST